MGRGFPVKMHKCSWFHSRHLLNACCYGCRTMNTTVLTFFGWCLCCVRSSTMTTANNTSHQLRWWRAFCYRSTNNHKNSGNGVVVVVWRLSNIRISLTSLNTCITLCADFFSVAILSSFSLSFSLSLFLLFTWCYFSWLYHCQYHIW